jgi:hypothetical protein
MSTPLDSVLGIAEVANRCFDAFVVLVNEEGETKGILLIFGWDLVDFAVVSYDQ